MSLGSTPRDLTPDRSLPRHLEPLQKPTPPPPQQEDSSLMSEPTPRELKHDPIPVLSPDTVSRYYFMNNINLKK